MGFQNLKKNSKPEGKEAYWPIKKRPFTLSSHCRRRNPHNRQNREEFFFLAAFVYSFFLPKAGMDCIVQVTLTSPKISSLDSSVFSPLNFLPPQPQNNSSSFGSPSLPPSLNFLPPSHTHTKAPS
ncbi:unnamed protein product [Coffea canephora]|uniref:Uncharacterized protein n=1 Tax=Coffea canephora TaxID=49390 RepID=A0A068V228_COFCA|nr:unnamed protein product [Coffea canephora]